MFKVDHIFTLFSLNLVKKSVTVIPITTIEIFHIGSKTKSVENIVKL